MIVLTGSSGVLGAALKSALQNAHGDVVSLTSTDGDLRDAKATLEIFEKYKPTAVYHAAARVHGIMGNQMFPAEIYLDNIRINTNVIEAARVTGCQKFVAVSTVAAYPGGIPLPMHEDAIWDGPPHGSEMFYAHAKRVMLAQLEAYKRQFGFDYAYALMTNLYGPHDRFDTAHGHVIPSLVAKFHKAATENSSVLVWGSGRAQRDFLYAVDAAEALLTIGEKGSGAFNVASGETVPIRSVVDGLQRISSVADVQWDAEKPDGQLDRSYDVSRLKGLGFEPRHSLEDGLEATYRWYCEHYPDVRT
ncbi:NAD-dependent epimerase/dehydratase family protein [Amorphus coralli]|uniref:NAD-dependent epimerase/dehydratase family protein n=1 Tax=Amorphus coralli TaxID=340680 RepID=UPI00036B62CB|nr:NAD-dependent epimerase/dehydratase family protein [Amorphus coralli]